ncbi:hypothetical protein B0T22DRAFT_463789 [Podospora appendiculata]|uniref:Uncharacterized protein n=1 Tax=Podospora appendiculata TaxID=314037 RepID=A0AAE0XDE0_9PEZI|nr:hypothetical protein B0T22DRAFT_463789 [Podospora appendiculata]
MARVFRRRWRKRHPADTPRCAVSSLTPYHNPSVLPSCPIPARRSDLPDWETTRIYRLLTGGMMKQLMICSAPGHLVAYRRRCFPPTPSPPPLQFRKNHDLIYHRARKTYNTAPLPATPKPTNTGPARTPPAMASGPPFVMTPWLEDIRARGLDSSHHPMLPADVPVDRDGRPLYGPAVAGLVPAMDDKEGILRFFGLDDAAAASVLDEYRRDANLKPAEVRLTKIRGRVAQLYRFPVADRLREIFAERTALAADYERSYEGYIKGGLAEGLRPEFAIFCGLHESEPRYSESYAQFHYARSCKEHADEVVLTAWSCLRPLWMQKLELEQEAAEGKRSAKR